MVSKPHLTQTRFHSEFPLILMWASMVIPYVISFVRCVHYEVSYVCIPTVSYLHTVPVSTGIPTAYCGMRSPARTHHRMI